MANKKLITLASLFAVFLILIVLFFTGGAEREQELPLTNVPELKTDSEELPESKTVTLFFLSEEDGKLHGEEREIISNPSLIFEIKQTIEQLLGGSNEGYITPFPAEAKLREVFMMEDGIVYVDFSEEIQDENMSGADAEISTVYAVVNSLSFNFDQIKRVFILVDGNEKETLNGHVDISRPLVPVYDLISN